MTRQINVQASDGRLGSGTWYRFPTRGITKHDSHSVLHVLDGTSAPHPLLMQPVLAGIWATPLKGFLSGRGLEVTARSAKYRQIGVRNKKNNTYFTRFVLVDDRVVRRVPQGSATGIDLIIWNLYHYHLRCIHSGSCNISPSETDPSETTSRGNETCTTRHNDYPSKKEVCDARVGPVGNGHPPKGPSV